MNKKEIHTSIGEEITIECDYCDKPVCINELQEFINEAKNKGATHLEFGGGGYDGTEWVDIQPINIKTESDLEYNQRIKKEEEEKVYRANLIIEEEKRMLANLKLKYEN